MCVSIVTVHLLLEVPDGIGISVCEQVKNGVSDAVVLEVVHQVSAIALEGGT